MLSQVVKNDGVAIKELVKEYYGKYFKNVELTSFCHIRDFRFKAEIKTNELTIEAVIVTAPLDDEENEIIVNKLYQSEKV